MKSQNNAKISMGETGKIYYFYYKYHLQVQEWAIKVAGERGRSKVVLTDKSNN